MKKAIEEPEVVQPMIPEGFKLRECEFCEQDILPDEKHTKQIGHYYHRSCWEKAKSMAPI